MVLAWFMAHWLYISAIGGAVVLAEELIVNTDSVVHVVEKDVQK